MMKVKKSLEMAKAEALKLSKEHPTILYRAMDKKGQMGSLYRLRLGISGESP